MFQLALISNCLSHKLTFYLFLHWQPQRAAKIHPPPSPLHALQAFQVHVQVSECKQAEVLRPVGYEEDVHVALLRFFAEGERAEDPCLEHGLRGKVVLQGLNHLCIHTLVIFSSLAAKIVIEVKFAKLSFGFSVTSPSRISGSQSSDHRSPVHHLPSVGLLLGVGSPPPSP